MRPALARAPVTRPLPRFEDRDPCGGETVIDFALCLILAVAVVGLLLLAAS